MSFKWDLLFIDTWQFQAEQKKELESYFLKNDLLALENEELVF